MARYRRNNPACSFCHRDQDEVERLISGPNQVYICDECVVLCQEILAEDAARHTAWGEVFLNKMLAPQEIYNQLNQYVIGQEHAKKVLSVAVYNHYKRVWSGNQDDDVELSKSNIILIGPTGCGKTLLAQTLARILDVPFTIADSTSLTEAGYVGEDVESILTSLLQAADGDITRVEKGIVYIDEIDKTARKSGEVPSATRDISGEGVQQALLKMLEGSVINVPMPGKRALPFSETVKINTTNILFICGGSFDGIDKLISARVGNRKVLGFTGGKQQNKPPAPSRVLQQITAEDLMAFGLIPEFVGRLPVVASVHPLDEDMLVRILTEPRNAIVKQYKKLFALDRVELEFNEGALHAAARKAMQCHTGARGLRTIIEQALLEIMYEIPSRRDVQRCVITEETILNREPPQFVARSEPAPPVVKRAAG